MSTVLSAKSRTSERRSQLSDVRNQGNIPAVVYGYRVENTPITINSAEFLKTMREVGRNGVISLDLEGKKLNVLLHEYQEDPLRKEVIHADFLVVDMSVEIEASVRVELSEDAVGVKSGGVLQTLLHELSVTAIPDEIPEVIHLDIANLDIGESLTVGEIRNQFSCKINHEDDEPIANIQPPRTEEEDPDGGVREENPSEDNGDPVENV
ncbi:50S ribosomal protein L25/general stress protein Ctc [Lederbergia citrea]|uniref:Large ribosomal subunit protein bL25 n=1 Tax=Lederbergia citrea TaxID=2833581 RepID=A0A942UPE5_9BACI|nr:50S ribosomal protein L25/general stress protein Ctc [Lederbergia citrea]MBS4179731.1 50S ribosomal protein L25/general stress protein Ctc [Lederbergia citrea]MBS4206420.1 50S ribosomal protein L25/general stress protein Ctc [Lederbergia citrea]MBS4225040.1 50S ribosomal protein L25/general stress protein Ctc [Lederbergia citrea]